LPEVVYLARHEEQLNRLRVIATDEALPIFNVRVFQWKTGTAKSDWE
jgi:hypothetical protein